MDDGIQILVATGIGLVVTGVILAIAVTRFHRRVSQGQALIITRMQGEPRVSFGSALVLPIVHHAEVMDISVKPLVLSRRGKDGLICRDSIRADVEATFFVRVNPTVEDVRRVAQAIGVRRASELATLEGLFTARLSEALKTVAAHLDFVQLYSQRENFKDEVMAVVGRDLSGFVLDDVAIDFLEQTPIEHLDPSNVIDAQGIRKIQELTSVERSAAAAQRPAIDDGDRRTRTLERHGLLDVRVAVEVSCEIHAAWPALDLRLGGGGEERQAALPARVTSALLGAVGDADLACGAGRATLRWRSPDVSEAQLLAGARLVHAFRDDPSGALR